MNRQLLLHTFFFFICWFYSFSQDYKNPEKIAEEVENLIKYKKIWYGSQGNENRFTLNGIPIKSTLVRYYKYEKYENGQIKKTLISTDQSLEKAKHFVEQINNKASSNILNKELFSSSSSIKFKQILIKGLKEIKSKIGFGNFFLQYININSKNENTKLAKSVYYKSYTASILRYIKILGFIILLIIILSDVHKYAIYGTLKEDKQENIKWTQTLIKYFIVVTVTIFPKFYCSLAEGIYIIINKPAEFVIENSTNKEDNRNSLNQLVLYNTIASEVYDDDSVITSDEIKTYEEKTINGKIIKHSVNANIYKNIHKKIWINTYYSIAETLYVIQDLAWFVLNIISQIMIYICVILFPIAILLEFLPNFKGGVASMVKYIVNFSLWGIIAHLIKALTVNFTEMQKTIDQSLIDNVLKSVSKGENFDTGISYVALKHLEDNATLGNLFLAVIMIVIMFIVPKISDMLISGSQSGAFFSAVTGAATYGLKKVSGMATGKALKLTSFVKGKLGNPPSGGKSSSSTDNISKGNYD